MGQPAAVSYEVTAVAPDTQFSPTGPAVAGKRISIKTSTGYEGSVFVPAAVFADAGAVRRLIEGEVKMVVAAQQIAGTVSG